MTIANKTENPATVAVLAQSQIVYNFLFDKAVFGISFTGLQIVGMISTLCFSFFVAIKNMQD